MKNTWEYERLKIEFTLAKELINELNVVGADGWEVIQYEEIKPEKFGDKYMGIVLLKKQINGSKKNVVIRDEDFSAITVIKPFSEEYLNQMIVVSEDAHGELRMDITPTDKLRKRLNYSDEEFNEILNQL